MRKRRPTRLRLRVDREATAAMGFHNRESWIDLKGSWHLRGEDMSAQREEVLRRDRYRCVRCSATMMLEVHHIQSRGRGGGDAMGNLETLCRPCHRSAHNREVQWTPKARMQSSSATA